MLINENEQEDRSLFLLFLVFGLESGILEKGFYNKDLKIKSAIAPFQDMNCITVRRKHLIFEISYTFF